MIERFDNSMSISSRLLWSLIFITPSFYFAAQHDYVATAVLVAAGIGGFSGYWCGVTHLFSSVVGIGAAVALAPSIGLDHELRFQQWFGTTGLTNRLCSVGAVSVLILLAVSIGVLFCLGRTLRDRPHLVRLNRWTGFGLGVAQGAAAVICLLGGMLIIEPLEQARSAQRSPDDHRGIAISKFVLETARQTRESQLGPFIDWANPFTRIPGLNKLEEVQRTASVLSNPAKIGELMRHPSIRQLQQQPEVRNVVEQLNRDPKVQQLLQSGQPMNRAAAMTLLNHPAVLQLVDQPGFLEEAARVIHNTTLGSM